MGVRRKRKVGHKKKRKTQKEMKAERDEPERTKKGEKSRVRKRRTGRKMNNKRNYKKGYKNEIIQLLHIVAVIPYRSLRLLSDNCRMYQRAVREMAEDKTVINAVEKRISAC